MLLFTRSGGFRPPVLDESLRIADDGTFELWRSVGNATLPATPVGRFAGTVDPLTGRVDGDQVRQISPDSPVDRLEVDGAVATLGIHDEGEGGWAGLLAEVRPLLAELTGQPLAAVGLSVDGGVATLTHLGQEPIGVDLAGLELVADHWRAGSSEGRWRSTPEVDDVAEVGPGWRLDLPLDHGFDLQDGDRVAVKVTFSLRDGERTVAASLSAG